MPKRISAIARVFRTVWITLRKAEPEATATWSKYVLRGSWEEMERDAMHGLNVNFSPDYGMSKKFAAHIFKQLRIQGHDVATASENLTQILARAPKVTDDKTIARYDSYRAWANNAFNSMSQEVPIAITFPDPAALRNELDRLKRG